VWKYIVAPDQQASPGLNDVANNHFIVFEPDVTKSDVLNIKGRLHISATLQLTEAFLPKLESIKTLRIETLRQTLDKAKEKIAEKQLQLQRAIENLSGLKFTAQKGIVALKRQTIAFKCKSKKAEARGRENCCSAEKCSIF